MLLCYSPLYRQLENDLELCNRDEPDNIRKTEKCFWISNQYWLKAKEFYKKPGVRSESEEIHFFREVKPRFTSNIEYFAIVNEALTFSEKNNVETPGFWDEEMSRFSRFCSKHSSFIIYIEGKNHVQDRKYFVKACSDGHPAEPGLFYDSDLGHTTFYDRLLSRYYALKRYYQFCADAYKKAIIKICKNTGPGIKLKK